MCAFPPKTTPIQLDPCHCELRKKGQVSAVCNAPPNPRSRPRGASAARRKKATETPAETTTSCRWAPPPPSSPFSSASS